MGDFLKRGFYWSAIMHGAVLVGLCLVFLVGHFTRKKPTSHVFELAVGPARSSVAHSTFTSTKSAVKTAEAVSAPSKTVVKKELPKGKTSYEEFIKSQKAASNKSSKPKTVAVAGVEAPKIQTSDIRKNLEQKLSSIEQGGISGGGGDYQSYVRSVIDASWRQPEDFSGYSNPALFEFDVDKMGCICNVRIVKSSGCRGFDQSIESAFLRAGIIKPAPDGKMLAGCRLAFAKKAKKL